MGAAPRTLLPRRPSVTAGTRTQADGGTPRAPVPSGVICENRTGRSDLEGVSFHALSCGPRGISLILESPIAHIFLDSRVLSLFSFSKLASVN